MLFDSSLQIVGDAGLGNDSINVAAGVTLPVELSGGAGDDQLAAGLGPAILRGGSGDDTLSGGAASAGTRPATTSRTAVNVAIVYRSIIFLSPLICVSPLGLRVSCVVVYPSSNGHAGRFSAWQSGFRGFSPAVPDQHERRPVEWIHGFPVFGGRPQHVALRLGEGVAGACVTEVAVEATHEFSG